MVEGQRERTAPRWDGPLGRWWLSTRDQVSGCQPLPTAPPLPVDASGNPKRGLALQRRRCIAQTLRAVDVLLTLYRAGRQNSTTWKTTAARLAVVADLMDDGTVFIALPDGECCIAIPWLQHPEPPALRGALAVKALSHALH